MNNNDIINDISGAINTEYLRGIQKSIHEYIDSNDISLIDTNEIIDLYCDRLLFLIEEERLNSIKELFRNNSLQFSISFFGRGKFINSIVSNQLEFAYVSILGAQKGQRGPLRIDRKLRETFNMIGEEPEDKYIFENPSQISVFEN